MAREHTKMKVLVFVKYFMPAFKGGGPLKTLKGMSDYLGDDVELSIITQDRDYQDTEPFPDLPMRCWVKHGPTQVCYTDRVSRSALQDVLSTEAWDVLYLQSLFDPRFTLKPLLWWKLGLLKAKKVVVATRGECSTGAVQIKDTKKRWFLRVARWLGLYKGVYWQASSEREKADILRELPGIADEDRLFIASDLPPKPSAADLANSSEHTSERERLRIVFLSRITAMKNLEFALEALSGLLFPAEFNIYGPIDRDQAYWESLVQQMNDLPPHIEATYHGSVSPERVPATFAEHDVFLLPTRGENFGHVVFESLQAGCPVLLSDQTRWQDLGEQGVGWVYPLDDVGPFRQALTQLNSASDEDRIDQRKACRDYAERFISGGDVVKQNREMFEALRA